MPQSTSNSKINAGLLVSIGAVAIAFLWSYWPTIVELVSIWEREPDYSHGYLVVPISIYFLWLRRSEIPTVLSPSSFGLILLAASIGIRYLAARFSITSGDGYSILVWLAGVVLLFGGRQLFVWMLPSIGFLFFMVPLPFRIERLMSVPLQMTAANISCFALQCMGQPAFGEGTTILLGDQQLYVEEACSGLRIFFGTMALAFAYIIAARRELWEAAILLVSVIPIALFANSVRIVVIAFLFQHYSDETARKYSHDISSWLMIPFAAACFGLLIWYLNCLVRRSTSFGLSDLVELNRSQA